jgi:hypothetical protein
MRFSAPVERCLLDFVDAPYSCEGDAVSFAANRAPIFDA